MNNAKQMISSSQKDVIKESNTIESTTIDTKQMTANLMAEFNLVGESEKINQTTKLAKMLGLSKEEIMKLQAIDINEAKADTLVLSKSMDMDQTSYDLSRKFEEMLGRNDITSSLIEKTQANNRVLDMQEILQAA